MAVPAYTSQIFSQYILADDLDDPPISRDLCIESNHGTTIYLNTSIFAELYEYILQISLQQTDDPERAWHLAKEFIMSESLLASQQHPGKKGLKM